MAANVGQINAQLAELFRNGRGESGLEVGTDPGLAQNEFIQIPRSLIKQWVVRTPSAAGASDDTPIDTLAGRPGWMSTGKLMVNAGTITHVADDTDNRQLSSGFRCAPPVYDDVRKFVVANISHIRDAQFGEETVKWVHAVRFWSVVSGFVATSKQAEWVLVDDPTGNLDSVNDIANFIIGFSGNAWTAAAARATSWRKSNHATGGDRATGFPRRWLSKMGYWPTTTERAARLRDERSITDAFYVATHACSVHAVLALMASSDANHWALIDPKFGLITQWDVMESTSVRMSPPTQVAGAAMVVDAVVTFRMMLREGIAPLLENFDQYTELMSQYRIVEENGIRVASYAGWFLAGHPQGVTKVPFAQKDAISADIIGELGAVATKYYSNTSIGESLALENAAQQMGTDSARNMWAALNSAKRAASARTVIQAFGRIKGASAASNLVKLLSREESELSEAVTAYNDRQQAAATLAGVTLVPTIEAARILSNADAADRQATSIEELAASAAST